MIDIEKLAFVKSASVAIGLVNKGGIKPKAILGSGFFTTSHGYVMTADHVVEGCERFIEYFRKENRTDAEIAVFHVNRVGQRLHLEVVHSATEWKTSLKREAKGYTGPENLDVGIIIPREKMENLPFLRIKSRESMQQVHLYDRICMCGYPSGEQSLDIARKLALRFSPVMQFGRVTGFMPFDNFLVPWGLQTDIVGTGGSSGSPIVDPFDGTVIGIAQQVLLSDVTGIYKEFSHTPDGGLKKKVKSVSGKAKLGLVYGITAYCFYGLPEHIEKNRRQGIQLTTFKFPTSGLHPIDRN